MKEEMLQCVLNTMLEKEACSVYWKDSQGAYLGYNPYAANRTLQDGYDGIIIGSSDYDIFNKKMADQFYGEDQRVMESDRQLIFSEGFALFHNIKTSQLTIKRPLYDSRQEIIGILGITYDLDQLSKKRGDAALTKREIDVLACLYHGLTQEKTAEKLMVSIRTIHSHVENIKMKLRVKTKNDILTLINLNNTQNALELYYRYILPSSSPVFELDQ
jgi:DNA-binding CsgD family transcriptional regulator